MEQSVQQALERRLNLTDLHREILNFSDVCLALLRDSDTVVLGNRRQQLGTINHKLSEVAHHFGGLSKIVTQTRITPDEWRQLLEMNIKKLYLSTENLTILGKLTEERKMKQLKSLYILCRVDQAFTKYQCFPKLTTKILGHFVNPSLSRVCLTGVRLNKVTIRIIFSLPNLKSLDLIGTSVLSKGMASFQQTLVLPLHLEEVSLPPSWFSFSTAASYPPTLSGDSLAYTGSSTYSFSSWHLPKICLYVHLYDEDLFWQQLEYYLPTNLETLVLYGNTRSIRGSNELASWQKFDILFGPNESQLLNLYGCGVTKLISHHVCRPPFDGNSVQNWMRMKPQKARRNRATISRARTTDRSRSQNSRARRFSWQGRLRARTTRRSRASLVDSDGFVTSPNLILSDREPSPSDRSLAGSEEEPQQPVEAIRRSNNVSAQAGSAVSRRPSEPAVNVPVVDPPVQAAAAVEEVPNHQLLEEDINAMVELILANVTHRMDEINDDQN